MGKAYYRGQAPSDISTGYKCRAESIKMKCAHREMLSWEETLSSHHMESRRLLSWAPVLMPVILVTWEAEIGKIAVWGHARPHVTPFSKNNQSKMDWRCGSSDRSPALQVTCAVLCSSPWLHNKVSRRVAAGGCIISYYFWGWLDSPGRSFFPLHGQLSSFMSCISRQCGKYHRIPTASPPLGAPSSWPFTPLLASSKMELLRTQEY
jgi:hypothetical protein